MKSEDFQEVFLEVRRLPGSLLVHYILEDFREDFFESQIQISKTRSEKHAYPKTFYWLQNRKNKCKIK